MPAVRDYIPDIEQGRQVMTSTVMARLLEAERIAAGATGRPVTGNRVRHILRTRPHLFPEYSTGDVRLYDRIMLDFVREELEAIEARRSNATGARSQPSQLQRGAKSPLITSTEIADQLERERVAEGGAGRPVTPNRVRHILRTRRHIYPEFRAAERRLYDPIMIDFVRDELRDIDKCRRAGDDQPSLFNSLKDLR